MTPALIVLLAVVGLPFAILILMRPVYGLYAGVALSGVLITPNFPIIGEKLAPPDAPLLLSLIGLFFSIALGAHRRLPVPEPARFAIKALGVFVFIAAMSFAANATFRGADVFQSLIEVLNYVYAYLVLVAFVILVDDWAKWERFILAWMIGVAVVAAISTAAAFGVGPEWAQHGGGRIKSTVRSVNQLQAYLGPPIPVLFGIIISPRWPRLRIPSIAVMAMVFLALAVTGSRTAFVMIGFAVVAIAIYSIRFMHQNRLAAVVTAFAAVGFFIFAVNLWQTVAERGTAALPPTMRAIARPIERGLFTTGIEEQLGVRARQIDIVADHWFENIPLGVGPGNFIEVFNHPNSVHNTYLGVLMEMGLPALLVLLAALGAITWGGLIAAQYSRNQSRTVMLRMVTVAFLLVCVYGLGSFGLRQRPFWLTGGVVLSGIILTLGQIPALTGPARRPPAPYRPRDSNAFATRRSHLRNI